jgi:hypothetical protein
MDIQVARPRLLTEMFVDLPPQSLRCKDLSRRCHHHLFNKNQSYLLFKTNPKQEKV